jgi:pyruvate/2-oxoglutarate dehydrogenase complex dihydrolipoamide acyltransferase (E2) component
MSEKTEIYHVVDLPAARRAWLNSFDLQRPKHVMYGLLEVDVTVIRQFIAKYKAQTGETLSFTGYLTYCLARAVENNKEVQAYRKGRGQLALFDDVDVGLMIEQQVGEKRELTGYVLRGANHKTFQDIHQEIRSAQHSPPAKGKGVPTWFRSTILLPWPLYRIFTASINIFVRRDPAISVLMQGAVGITSVGMFGRGHGGWGISSTRHSLDLVVGSITWKPAVVKGQIEPREILNLTVVFDHDVIDGAPAARFVRQLVELIESGNGMSEIEKENIS